MNKIFTILILIFVLSGCVNIREPYPVVEYYILKQDKTMLKDLPKSKHSVMLRRVVVNESFDTPHLLINHEGSKVQKLFYHRWIADISTISTDFVITRLNESGLLSKGVIRSSSVATPEYIIEPQLIDMTAFKSDTGDVNNNYVSIEIKVDIVKRMPNNNLDVVFSKLYQQKYIMNKTEISYIPDAYSKVFSIAVDNLIADLSNVLK
jgi:ABC-type uncharacterized transport system auxiliary subunit